MINKKNVFLIIIIIAFIASLVPMLYIAKFNYPYRDDFSFSANTYNALKDTSSVYKVIEASIEKTEDVYYSWQGSFSAVFLFTLSPNIWGERTYAITTYIMLTAFILSTLFFAYNLLFRLFKLSIWNCIIVSILIMLLSIQFVPSPVQSFYWYNGSVYYLFFYSLELFLLGGVARLFANEKLTMWKYFIIYVPLTFFVGGGNFVTALTVAIMLFLASVFLIWKKDKKWIFTVSILVADLVSFAISVNAPGNAIRQSFFEQKYTAIGAIFKSFDAGLTFTFTLFDAPKGTLGIIILVILSTMPLLAKIIMNPDYKFKYPFAAVLLAFCVFCAQFTPTIYAMGGYGPARLINIIYFSYIWFLMFVVTYLTGWSYRKIYDALKEINQLNQLKEALCCISGKLKLFFLTIVIVSCSALLYTIVDERAVDLPTSFSAVRSIVTGEAYVYHLQQQERLQLLQSEQKVIVLKPLTVFPEVLHMDDYVNEGIEAYFNKDEVEIKK